MIDRKDYGGEMTVADALKPVEKTFDYVIVDTSWITYRPGFIDLMPF